MGIQAAAHLQLEEIGDGLAGIAPKLGGEALQGRGRQAMRPVVGANEAWTAGDQHHAAHGQRGIARELQRELAAERPAHQRRAMRQHG